MSTESESLQRIYELAEKSGDKRTQLTALRRLDALKAPGAKQSQPIEQGQGVNPAIASLAAGKGMDVKALSEMNEAFSGNVEMGLSESDAIGKAVAERSDPSERESTLRYLDKHNPDMAALLRETPPAQALGASYVNSLVGIGRGLGIADQQADFEKAAFSGLEKTSGAAKIGKIGGEVAPFLVGSAGLGSMATNLGFKLPARMAIQGGIGAGEGGILKAGQGAEGGEIALHTGLGLLLGITGEAAAPLINRMARNTLGTLTGRRGIDQAFDANGAITPEAKKILNASGVDEKAFVDKVMTKENLDEAQQATLKERMPQPKLQETGTIATRGEAMQQAGDPGAFAQLKTENQLFEESSEAGNIFRGLKLQQSRELQKLIGDLSPGDASNLAPSLKGAIELRESSAKFKRTQAYNTLAAATKDIDVGLSVKEVSESLPSAKEYRRYQSLSSTGGQGATLKELLVEFGVVYDDAIVKKLAKDGVDVEPISVANYEDFRKALGNIEKTDVSGNTSTIVGPIRKALDGEFELASKALEETGDESVSAAAKNARLSHIALKTEFDEKGIVNQLIAPKSRGSDVPKIADSKAYAALVTPSLPVEQFSSLVKSLGRAGSKGRHATAQIKSQMILDLMDSGFGAGTRKIDGERVFGAGAFIKRYDALEPKLKSILSPKEFRKLSAIRKDVKDLQHPGGTTVKGSAGFFIDALRKVGFFAVLDKVPGAGAIASDQFEKLGRAAKSTKALKVALKAPETKAANDFMIENFPSLAKAVKLSPAAAIPAVAAEEKND